MGSSCWVGVAAHEVRGLQSEHAGEGVDADVVVGPVVHWGERHLVGIFELAEGELGLGLGAVASHHLGDRPVVAVGDQHAFAEDLLFECVAGGGSRWKLSRCSAGVSPVSW